MPIARTIFAALLLCATALAAEPIFVEAEKFTPSSDGWQVCKNQQTRAASALTSLHGADGDPKGTAATTVQIPAAGNYRVWVRYIHHSTRRGPFRLAVFRNGRELGGEDFDLEAKAGLDDWSYPWDSFDLDLPAGPVELRLSKFENRKCSGYVRHVDCVLLTTDKALSPSHTPYGPQTYLRVTLGEVYDKPVYLHIFADHYRSPWYGHYNLSKAGAAAGLAPAKAQMLAAGESTPWCNITPMLYQDSGAILNFTVRYSYTARADRLKGRFDFAAAPDEKAIVRTMEADCTPNGLVVVAPPDLTTEENRRKLLRDKDAADAAGRIADAYDWPKIGKAPEKFPFFVEASIGGYGTPVDQSVVDREWKTLDYFGFVNRRMDSIGGSIWRMKNGSYCRPDVEVMKTLAAQHAGAFAKDGRQTGKIVFCMLMDEPTGQPADFLAGDEACGLAFRAWLKRLGLTPAQLGVADWDAAGPVADRERDKRPELYYFTQRFRTRALGDFMAVQRGILEQAYGAAFPVAANFSDGATFHANFYSQGVDYFELLDDDRQNAIWGEDWANVSSSYQCGAFNVDLMRAAARPRGQTVGHFLIAYAGRKAWDTKLKAAGELARGAKVLVNYYYGPSWGSHSRGWYDSPAVWRANAEIVREVGAAEDLLLPAVPLPAATAILYSSSTDVWTLGVNYAFGFDRMHTWMALAHAQTPVDFVAERQVEAGRLDGYRVCYLSGPNLSRAAAARLKDWVERGGVLFMTAGAASRDEYNRPLDTLDGLLPAARKPLAALQGFVHSGRSIHTLTPQDTVVAGAVAMDVLSVKQALTPRERAETLARFKDGGPALVRGTAGKGVVYCAGFLPALDYVRKALVARNALAAEHDAAANRTTPLTDDERKRFERLERSHNPWQFPADVRDLLLEPVRRAGIEPPLTCSAPLVDAVVMACDAGLVIPLANYTLAPLPEVRFTLRPGRPVGRVESVHHGALQFTRNGGTVSFALPLDSTDFIKVYPPAPF